MIASLSLIPVREFQRVNGLPLSSEVKLGLLADMCRANTLMAVKRAGSGHLGSSFSAMDIVVSLYFAEMTTVSLGFNHPDRDIYFSSKGHDAPGLYSVLFALGVIPKNRFLKLRRYGGLDGHPDIEIPGIESNSGSLGMGISKGRGLAWAKRYSNRGGRVFVMTGDGELQEGQNYEALQAAVSQGVTNLSIIVDHNKVQSDKQVREIIDLGDLEKKLQSFGWHVAQCDGHDFLSLASIWKSFTAVKDKPKVLIAHTIKGKGVSFMEHPRALKDGNGYYRWHAGAPDDLSFLAAYDEILSRINQRCSALGLPSIELEEVEPCDVVHAPNSIGEPVSAGADGTQVPVKEECQSFKSSTEYVVDAYGKALTELAAQRPDIVVLDADLAADCRTRQFELAFPDRFIQCGIAEQDMVSMAGGLARQGLLPVVNSFASFLASRANEQIYNNASEKTKIIYAMHYAGLIPAGPGKSHQSIRDISLISALPNVEIIQPSNGQETRAALDYCVNVSSTTCVLRLAIGPSPRLIHLPKHYSFACGCGVALTEGTDAVLFAYGPVMLHEALTASEHLAMKGFGLKVVNMPWLNRVEPKWLCSVVMDIPRIFVLDDHAPQGGLGDFLLNTFQHLGLLDRRDFFMFAIDGYPACGTPTEVLAHHRLDGLSLSARILQQSELNIGVPLGQ